MEKSTRHSKIAGDFAEAFLLYWLSKYGYECARIDHTGIDLIAANVSHPESVRMGISVKCRSRYEGTENSSVNLPPDGFEKAKRACEAFKCVPYYAILVDGADAIRCFLLSLEHLLSLVGGEPGKMHYWPMTAKSLEAYRRDPLIQRFELTTEFCSWRDASKDSISDEQAVHEQSARRKQEIPMNESGEGGYPQLYDVEDIPVRISRPRAVPEVYCGGGKWKPYTNRERLGNCGQQVTESEFSKLIEALDERRMKTGDAEE